MAKKNSTKKSAKKAQKKPPTPTLGFDTAGTAPPPQVVPRPNVGAKVQALVSFENAAHIDIQQVAGSTDFQITVLA